MDLAENLANVEARIAAACERAGRLRSTVQLVAVSKMHPVSSIQQFYELGIRDFGESRVQELLTKQEHLPKDIRWHFISPLQSNKAKYLAPFVHLIHAVGSRSGLDELGEQADKAGRELNVLLQINISHEPQKHGFDRASLMELVCNVPPTDGLNLRGLMGMASFEEDPENTREQFRHLKLLHTEVQATFPHFDRFTELSMGMTNDFEVAIEEGSTLVRIGSALFGERG